jgi:NADPH:quinone reductase-like Zn-dependent oxidoreductase
MTASTLAPVSLTSAAGFMLAGMTAYQALTDRGKLENGQSVFINGGSSSVGAFAIQIAKAKGCKVITKLLLAPEESRVCERSES